MTAAPTTIKDVLDNWIEGRIGLTSLAKASSNSEWEATGTYWGTNQPLASSGLFAATLFAKLSWKSEWGNKCNLTLTCDKMKPVSCDATIGDAPASYADLASPARLNEIKINFKLSGDTQPREAKINTLFHQVKELVPAAPTPSRSPSPSPVQSPSPTLPNNLPNDSSSSSRATSGEQTASSPAVEEPSTAIDSNKSEEPAGATSTPKDGEPVKEGEKSPPSARGGIIKRFIDFWILFGWLSFLREMIKKKIS